MTLAVGRHRDLRSSYRRLPASEDSRRGSHPPTRSQQVHEKIMSGRTESDENWDDNRDADGDEEKMPLEVAEQEPAMEQEEEAPPPRTTCCAKLWHYGGISEAKGYALIAMGRGAAVMSNVVVNVALLELASEAAGCPTGAELREMEAEGIIESVDDYECEGKVYGQNPISLISNIGVVSGLLGTFFMPFIGVILDFTPYRRFTGILFSFIFIVIQAAQIGISSKTWFPMAVLQSIAGFCFYVNIVTALAYLPEICEQAGQLTHARYTARFTSKQFLVQISFVVLVGVLSFATGLSDSSVQTARLSQVLNVAIAGTLYTVGWKFMPSRPAARELPEGMRCFGTLLYGIKQNIRTAVSINRDYKKGLRWYLLATAFCQSGVGALTTVSALYLSSEVGLNAADINIFWLVSLFGTLLGARFSSILAKRTNPNTSWQLSMIALFITLVIGAFTVGDAPSKYFSLLWGCFVGVMLGWFYPTENLLFSCILPKSQEAEIAGFRVYCSMILSWLPPLIFSVLISRGVDIKWGMTLIASFLPLAASILRFGAGGWEEILRESGRSDLAAEHDT